MQIVEELATQYGEFINIVVLIVDDAATVKKEFKGKLPMFRFYKNEIKGQAKRDSSFEILIPDKLQASNDLKKIKNVIKEEIEENFEHQVKIVTEKVYYPAARQETN